MLAASPGLRTIDVRRQGEGEARLSSYSGGDGYKDGKQWTKRPPTGM